jgi:hypothetical protein
MKKINLLYILFVGALFTFSSCKNDDKTETPQPTNTNTTGNVTIKINHTFGAVPLDFTTTFKNPSDSTEDLTFSTLQYILSNFKLEGNDGVWYDVPETYFYINQKNAQSLTFELKDVKIQNYKSMSFLIGVDSARNVSGVQSGGLDPSTGMFWSWNTGYIFFKVEGDCPQLTVPYGSSKFIYHIGGFKGQYNSLLSAYIPFGANVLSVKEGSNIINLKGDVKEVFEKPIPFHLTKTPQITLSGTQAVGFALNYVDMFTLKSIE